jgi:hypothetical protein
VTGLERGHRLREVRIPSAPIVDAAERGEPVEAEAIARGESEKVLKEARRVDEMMWRSGASTLS